MNNTKLSYSIYKGITETKKKANAHITHFIKTEHGSAGIEYIIVIAIGIVVASFIFLPGLRTFSSDLMNNMKTWFSGIFNKIFQTQ